MNAQSAALDEQINRLGLWSAVAALLTTVITFLLPLDIPEGYSAVQSDRVAWLVENRSLFILGWINQIAAMLALSGLFLALIWRTSQANPLRAMLAGFVVALSVMAFLIPKFIAVWTIPLLAEAISSGGAGSQLAAPLLLLLNVSVPFSLYTSFDYLGFWLYAVFGLLIAGPLYQKSWSSKLAATALGLFGALYHLALIALLAGAIEASDIESWFIGVSGLLLITVVAALVMFKRGNT